LGGDAGREYIRKERFAKMTFFKVDLHNGRQHYQLISILWKLIQDQLRPYYDLNTFKAHLRIGAPKL